MVIQYSWSELIGMYMYLKTPQIFSSSRTPEFKVTCPDFRSNGAKKCKHKQQTKQKQDLDVGGVVHI